MLHIEDGCFSWDRIHITNLHVLSNSIHYGLIWSCVLVQDLWVWEVVPYSCCECSKCLQLLPTIYEHLVFEIERESFSKKSHSEVISSWSKLFDDVVVEVSL